MILSQVLEVGLDTGQHFRWFAGLALVRRSLVRVDVDRLFGIHRDGDVDVNINVNVAVQRCCRLLINGGHRQLAVIVILVHLAHLPYNSVSSHSAGRERIFALLRIVSLPIVFHLVTRYGPFKVTFRSRRRRRRGVDDGDGFRCSRSPLMLLPRSQYTQPGQLS